MYYYYYVGFIVLCFVCVFLRLFMFFRGGPDPRAVDSLFQEREFNQTQKTAPKQGGPEDRYPLSTYKDLCIDDMALTSFLGS